MSSAQSPPGKEPATLQSTREILDELDALMDRMLAIPVNDMDDPAPPARALVHTPTVAATLTVLESPLEEEEPARNEQQTLRESFRSYSTDLAPAGAPMQSLPPPIRDPDPIPEEMIPPSITMLPVPIYRPDPEMKPVRLPRRSLASRCLLPLLWFNQAFDKITVVLGGPGRWLRGPGGRHALGLTGLALLVVAGLWLVKDWLGWTW
jgi:hypothetical protein